MREPKLRTPKSRRGDRAHAAPDLGEARAGACELMQEGSSPGRDAPRRRSRAAENADCPRGGSPTIRDGRVDGCFSPSLNRAISLVKAHATRCFAAYCERQEFRLTAGTRLPRVPIRSVRLRSVGRRSARSTGLQSIASVARALCLTPLFLHGLAIRNGALVPVRASGLPSSHRLHVSLRGCPRRFRLQRRER
jgi:hypothetical protein